MEKLETKTLEKTKEKEKVKEPEQFNVVLLNDDYTTMDFVVEILMTIFHKKIEDAFKIMLDIHSRGKGIVGRYTWDIASTKAAQVHEAARANEFPLKCVVQAE